MPDALHRVTKVLEKSVDVTELPEPVENYIINPDLSDVIDYPVKYWVITGNVLSLLDADGRAAVDALELESNRDAAMGPVDRKGDVLRAFMLVVLDEINNLRSDHGLPSRTANQLRNAIRNRLGE